MSMGIIRQSPFFVNVADMENKPLNKGLYGNFLNIY
ncbi:hypothetical protein CLOBOL_01756 [Enterocloster bolteae ATCC BAA-613]|uniref:Uncharacterized protein n=1 Tax=Enterocloster bolteae (strain ATCC BAA-613 / DSM 15670 / CCUG 46953 / JCM 12243 / WAL 16351) TaxID=411902 RepID=A8RLV8_ENTBW|nr:hypothetical protein CLOBOL_01756 [Enterocloster bolteae ATCC BAA-613]